MKVYELYALFNKLIPTELSCEWDNDGDMCVPDPEREVFRVLVTLDVTDVAVNEAIAKKCELIISHHPLIFHPMKRVVCGEHISDKLIKLIKNDVSVFSFHTRLDAVQGGVNDKIAEKIGLKNVMPYGFDGDMTGRVGCLEAPVHFDDFAEYLKLKFFVPCVNAVKVRDEVFKVAVLGGEGKNYYDAAVKTGADTFITGDAGYNFMIDASEQNINVVTLGHFYSEDVVCERIAEIIGSADDKIEINYFCSNKIAKY